MEGKERLLALLREAGVDASVVDRSLHLRVNDHTWLQIDAVHSPPRLRVDVIKRTYIPKADEERGWLIDPR